MTAIDGAHAALTQERFEFVGAKLCAGSEILHCCWTLS